MDSYSRIDSLCKLRSLRSENEQKRRRVRGRVYGRCADIIETLSPANIIGNLRREIEPFVELLRMFRIW